MRCIFLAKADRPSVLAGDNDDGRVDDALGADDLLDLVAENLLHKGAESLGLVNLKALLGDVDEGLALKLLELLDGVLVDGVEHVDDLEALGAEALDKGRRLDGLARLAGDVVDRLLALPM